METTLHSSRHSVKCSRNAVSCYQCDCDFQWYQEEGHSRQWALLLCVCPGLEGVVPNLANCVTGSPFALPLNSAKHPCTPLPIDWGRLRPKRKHRALMAGRACQKEQASPLPTAAPPSHCPDGATGDSLLQVGIRRALQDTLNGSCFFFGVRFLQNSLIHPFIHSFRHAHML